jgi:hypothetical protein
LPRRSENATETAIALLVAAVASSEAALSKNQRGNFIGSELSAVHRALSRLDDDALARGRIFCEWGSGLGGVCGVAAIHGFEPSGIEASGALVESARGLAIDRDLAMNFAQGTFLLPGDEDLATTAHRETRLEFDAGAWEEIDLVPADCDVVFAYPWPGEEAFVDGVFSRHASDDALLVTFHDFDRVLVQRKRALHDELSAIGWL